MKKKTSKKKTTTKRKTTTKEIPNLTIDQLLGLFSFDEFVAALTRRVEAADKTNAEYLKENKQFAKSAYTKDSSYFKRIVKDDEAVGKVLSSMLVALKDLKQQRKKITKEAMLWSIGL